MSGTGQEPRMLISHEWVEAIGGSENVFQELLATFPDADAACLWNNASSDFDRPVAESRLSRSTVRRHKALSLPLHPLVWDRWALDEYAVVLASSHAFGHRLASHAAREGRSALAYVHTPARYVWAPEVEARGRGALVRMASRPLRRMDRRATHPGVQYAANSDYIRKRVERAWGREATVIYPPVEVSRLQATSSWADKVPSQEMRLLEALPADGFVLGASRLVTYKRLDMVISVAKELGLPAVIAGGGPDQEALRSQAECAGIPVTFTGRVSNELLYALYQKAGLYVFLPVEDFGIMPVEAMALGTPVLVNSDGGASESVVAVGGGVATRGDAPIAEIAADAATALRLDMREASARVGMFSKEEFRRRIAAWVGGSTS